MGNLASLFLFPLLASQLISQKLVFPDRIYQNPTWTQEEQKKEIAIHHLYRSKDASTHLIRLAGKEFPHFHDTHDLYVTVMQGTSVLHFLNHQVTLSPGDTAFIPKKTYHWAENIGPDASIIFAVFSPGFNGQDRRKAK